MISPSMASKGRANPPHARTVLTERVTGSIAGALVLALSACGSPESEGDAAPEAGPSVRITAPADGARVAGGSVLVTLEVSGLTIAPAGTMDAGTGHHHLVVDADLPAAGTPIPATPGVHIHMGQAQTEYELTDLAAGEHTVIAVVGDGLHIPLDPWVADTVRFVVE
jgi:hypothetical protein